MPSCYSQQNEALSELTMFGFDAFMLLQYNKSILSSQKWVQYSSLMKKKLVIKCHFQGDDLSIKQFLSCQMLRSEPSMRYI